MTNDKNGQEGSVVASSDRALRVVGPEEAAALVLPAPRRSAKDIVPFGQYKGRDLSELLDDIPYCSWLVDQPWCRTKFPDVLRAAQAAVTAYETDGVTPEAPTTPDAVWATLTADQRIAVRVCAPELARVLGSA